MFLAEVDDGQEQVQGVDRRVEVGRLAGDEGEWGGCGVDDGACDEERGEP